MDGWRGERVRTVGVSFGVSVGIHALLFALVVLSFSRAAQQAPLVVSRVKLIYVDPAPAAAPPRGTAEGTAKVAPVVAPPLPVTPPRAVAQPVRPEKKVAKPKPVPPVSAPAARRVDEPAPPAPATAVASAEIPVGVASESPAASGDTPGGTADGVRGNIQGGRGSGAGVLGLGEVAIALVVVTRIVPEYPRRARLAGIEGEVVLEVIVDRHGRVAHEVKVVRSVPELERAAVAAVQRWRFRPARDRQGTAVAVVMEVPVRFVLHEATARKEPSP